MKKALIAIFICLLTCHYAAWAHDEAEQSDSAVWTRDPLQLETVVVTATRTPKTLADIPVVTRVITNDDMTKADATNIKDLLQQELPGLEFTYSMGQQVLNMGGYDGNNILFLVDGERMAGESMDNVDFSRLNMSGIERIEIVKGAASTLYGSSAMGGVVNIITKNPSEKWAANLNTRYEGATKEWRHGGNVDFSLGKINSLTTFQMTRNKVMDMGTLPTYGGKSYNAKERMTWNVNDALKITGRIGYFFRERENSSSSHERYRDLSDGLRLNWDITPEQNLEVAYSFDQYDKSDLSMLTGKDLRDYSNRQNIIRAAYNMRIPSLQSELTAGADYMHDYLMTYQFESNDNARKQNSYDAFVQWEYAPAPHWNFIGGLRYDYFSAADNGKPTWKLAGMYKTGNHQIRLSYASGFRTPSLKEMYMNFFMGGIFMIYGNPELKSETNHNISLSWANHGSLGDSFRYNVTAIGYYNFFNNYITTATVVRDGKSAQMYTNVADQKIAGADINAELHHYSGLGAKLCYAFVKNIVGKGQPDLTSARPHSLTWRLDYDHQFGNNYGLYVALSGRYLSSVNVAEYADTQLKSMITTHYNGYSIWKFTLSQTIIKGMRLNFAVDNIFNYKPGTYTSNSPATLGTTASIGVSVDIDKF